MVMFNLRIMRDDGQDRTDQDERVSQEGVVANDSMIDEAVIKVRRIEMERQQLMGSHWNGHALDIRQQDRLDSIF
jgi:hypothetical protein